MISLIDDLIWYVGYMARCGAFRDVGWLVLGAATAALLMWLPD